MSRPGEVESRGGAAPRANPVLRRLFSLTGVVPLNAFLVLHLFDMWRATQSRSAFESSLLRAPWPLALELVVLWLPLAFHAAYGVRLLLRGDSLELATTNPRDPRRILLRGAAWLTLAFLVWHLVAFRLRLALGTLAPNAVYDELCASLSSTIAWGIPLVAIGYVLGLAATLFHTTRGLLRMSRDWQPLARRKRVVAIALPLLGAVAFIWGLNSIMVLATGSNLLFAPASPHLGY